MENQPNSTEIQVNAVSQQTDVATPVAESDAVASAAETPNELPTDATSGNENKLPPPRTAEELQKAVSDLVYTVGECYLQIEFHKRNLEQFTYRSFAINEEVGRRQKIDQELADAKKNKAEEKRARKGAATTSSESSETAEQPSEA